MIDKKFRAWDKKNKRWFKTELPFYGFHIFGECTLVCPPSLDDLEHLEITQFIGIEDGNGKDIYGGDYVVDNVGREWLVKYDSTKASFLFYYRGLSHPQPYSKFNKYQKPLKIIGNKYENRTLKI